MKKIRFDRWAKAMLVSALALLLLSTCSTRLIWDIEDPGCSVGLLEQVTNHRTAFCAAYAAVGDSIVQDAKERKMYPSVFLRSVERLPDGEWQVTIFNVHIIMFSWQTVFDSNGNPVPIEMRRSVNK